jgi:hypothetical protein
MQRILQVVALALLIAQGACHRASSGAALSTLDWQTSPLDLNLRGMNGDRYRFRCPSGKPRAGSVTGSGLYTDASSICGAAVHAGAIDAQRGGIVVIQILPGQPSYHGSTQNFLHSSDYTHPWSGSFAVLATPGYDANAVR